MDEDSPDYLVHEIFTQNFWKDHPLGKPILGTKETVRHFEQPLVLDYYGSASRRQHDHCGRRAHEPRALRQTGGGTLLTHLKPATNGFHDSAPEAAVAHHPAQQEIAGAGADSASACLHLSHLPREALRVVHPEYAAGRRHELAAVPERSRAAGSGLRHLQRAESVSRYRLPVDLCRDLAANRRPRWCSRSSTSSATSKQNVISDEELRRTKDQLKGILMLSLESTTARMSNLARQEMYFDRFFAWTRSSSASRPSPSRNWSAGRTTSSTATRSRSPCWATLRA